ncbi:MAG: acyltransferase family protein [Nocardioides sp.]
MAGVETAARTTPRLAHLDRLKVVLTAGVIVAHAAMSYGAAGTWIYEEDSLSGPVGTVLSVLVGGGVLFVLGLFFLIAGMLTTGPLQRRGPLRFLRSRLARLGIPVLVYAVVVWPVLEWWIAAARAAGARS